MNAHSFHDRFAHLGAPRRIWVVPAIHGTLNALDELHTRLFDVFLPADRLVYMGGYLGAANAAQTVSHLVSFRRRLIAKTGVFPTDIAYLRGAQEELFLSLRRLSYDIDMRRTYQWMLDKGLSQTLGAYGASNDQIQQATREGAAGMTRFASLMNDKMRALPGHEKFMTILRRAAVTENEKTGHHILFVHSGLDPAKPLMDQKDSFWWEHKKFDQMTAAYAPFTKTVRGHDPEFGGLTQTDFSLSLGRSDALEPLKAIFCLTPQGDVYQVIEI